LKSLKTFLKYTIPLIVAGLLLWLVFRGLNIQEIFKRLESADYRWVLLSMIFAVFSHYLRAYRWTLLLKPIGYEFKTSRGFIAIMSGYLGNLALPRLGEVTRCAVLKKTDRIPLPASFGSVIVERIIDLLMLLLVILLALSLQFGRIGKFFSGMLYNTASGTSSSFHVWILVFILALFVPVLLAWGMRKRIIKTKLYLKIKPIIGEVINGFMSIRKVENKTLFFILTFGIWIFYYLMSYVMIYSFPATSGLSPLAGLVILMAGGLGMSAPVQGGIGTYHVFVSSVLVLYGIAHEDGVVYATLMHTSQLVFILVVGSISLLTSMLMVKKNKEDA
jgi:glycosyltransferase 2 family protein